MADTDPGYFSEENSADVVISRMEQCPDPRLKTVMSSIVRHLHQVVKEVEPTQEEWMAAIEFLTATGHMCDEWRQEFILLSDTLGVSMLVDAINNRKPSGATESTVLGPFHVSDAPRLEHGATICLDGKGEPLVISGRVCSTDGAPIAGALLDVWQANDEGFYDVQQPGIQPKWNHRGAFKRSAFQWVYFFAKSLTMGGMSSSSSSCSFLDCSSSSLSSGLKSKLERRCSTLFVRFARLCETNYEFSQTRGRRCSAFFVRFARRKDFLSSPASPARIKM